MRALRIAASAPRALRLVAPAQQPAHRHVSTTSSPTDTVRRVKGARAVHAARNDGPSGPQFVAMPLHWDRLVDMTDKSLSFATVDPEGLNATNMGFVENLVAGRWEGASGKKQRQILDPLNGEPFIQVAEVTKEAIAPYVERLRASPKYGRHNPIHNVTRYLMLGEVSKKAAAALGDPSVERFFTRLIQRVSPKSIAQAKGEVVVTRKFLENFSGDQVRFLAQASSMPGDHPGQSSHAYRFPYGPVAIVTPFNFPLEIPALQLMGALYMGNHPLLKVDEKVAVVMDQFMRLLHRCGLPLEDVDMVQCSGETMHALLLEADPRCTLFTGSSRVADILARDLKGKVKLEGSGFDWKVLGPDVPDAAGQEYIAHVCDQDAHACSGQKCSAQSLLVVHRNWADAGLYGRLGAMAAQRSLHDLTVGPTLSVSTATVKAHVAKLLALPGAELLWGGEELNGGQHNIPAQFGAMQPTAVRVPIEEVLANIHLCCTELFAPFQVVTEYTDEQLPLVLQLLEAQEEHLTAAVVSNDLAFQHEVLSKTTNGTTYVGLRARTTGAPQNHWFGPAGDPRAAGIGTADAIRQTWSCHREIIQDFAAVDKGWALPART